MGLSVQLVAAQFLLYAAGWGLCSLLLRERQLAVAHWATYLLLTGAGFWLTCVRGEPRTWWPYVGANLCFLLAYGFLRRGTELFMGLVPRDREALCTLAPLCLVLLAAGPGAETGAWRVLAAYTGGALMLGRLLVTVARPMIAEFGLRLSLLVSAPTALLVAMFVLRVLQQLGQMDQPLELHRDAGANQHLLFGYLVGAAVFNFCFMGLVTTRMVARLRLQSLRDPLTGLPNRRALDEVLAKERERVRRGGPAFSLVALDLDHFKRINDTCGHAGGDAVLEEAGRRLQATVRRMDTVARTGGEEFVVLAPATSGDAARVLAERLRQAIASRPFELPEGPLPVTVSIGVAASLPEETAPEQPLKRADAALYRAKEGGRNRVCVA